MKYISKACLPVCLLLCMLTATQHTHAIPIGFEGVVTEVTPQSGFPDPALFSVGDLLNGSYTFDASTLITVNLEKWGTYGYINSDLAFTLGDKIGSAPEAGSGYGDNTQSPDPATNPVPRDLFRFQAAQEFGLEISDLGDWYLVDFFILLEDFSNSAVPPGSPGNFLVDPVDVSLFPSNSFKLRFAGSDYGFTVGGTIESFFAAAVPEPTTLALISIGLIGLGVTRHKKKKYLIQT